MVETVSNFSCLYIVVKTVCRIQACAESFTLYYVCLVHWGIPWVHRADILSSSGDTVSTSRGYHDSCRGASWWKSLIYSENTDVLNVLRCTRDTPTCIMISPDVLMTSPRCTHDVPPMYWISPDVLMISPRCTHGIPSMYSWYPLDVLMVSPRCTKYPPMYWIHITQGVDRCQHSMGYTKYSLLN